MGNLPNSNTKYESPLEKKKRELQEQAAADKLKALALKEDITIDEAKNKLALSASNAKDRIAIVFDDSLSMGLHYSKDSKISKAKEAVVEFLRNCTPNSTAVAVFPLEAEPIPLSLELIGVAELVRNINTGNSTPLYRTLKKVLAEPITRVVAFSDGEPSDKEGTVIAEYEEKKIPIDTVYINDDFNFNHSYDDSSIIMKEIAERTGGIFIHFKGDLASFTKGLKYLAPGFRGMLTSGAVSIKDVEEGKVR